MMLFLLLNLMADVKLIYLVKLCPMFILIYRIMCLTTLNSYCPIMMGLRPFRLQDFRLRRLDKVVLACHVLSGAGLNQSKGTK